MKDIVGGSITSPLIRISTEGMGKDHDEGCGTYLEQFECPKINLQIRAKNHQVIEFYKSIGFLQEDVINMGKRLIPDLK